MSGSGARMAMPIWGRFMQQAYADSIFTKGPLDIPEDLESIAELLEASMITLLDKHLADIG